MPGHLSQDQLKRYQERTLAPGELVAVDDHLGACAICREALAGIGNGTAAALISGIEQARFQHLSFEQMDDWVEDRLDQSDRELVMAHIGLCSACARQLIAYQEYAPVMSAPIVPTAAVAANAPVQNVSLASRLWAFFRQPHIALGAAALIALFIVAPWNKHPAPELTGDITAPGSTAAESAIRDSNPAQGSQLTDAALSAAELDSLPDSLRLGAKQIIAAPERAERPASLKGLAPSNDSILEYPVSEVVEETQPVLRWKAFGASYDVSIFDGRNRLIARRGNLRDTRWTPPSALDRDMTYTWEVESSGQKHRGTFRVLSARDQQELQRVRAEHGTSHLVMGAVSEQLGLLSQARQEFAALAKENAGQAEKLVKRIDALRGMK